MYQIIQQTDEEKLAMYMKLSKEELAKMLIENNKVIERLTSKPVYAQWTMPANPNDPYQPFPSWPVVCRGVNGNVQPGMAASGAGKWCDCKHLEKSTAGFYCHGYCKH